MATLDIIFQNLGTNGVQAYRVSFGVGYEIIQHGLNRVTDVEL